MSLYPFFAMPPFSHSAVSQLRRCELLYYFQSMVSFQGLYATEHGPQCERAAIRRRIANPYGWSGTLMHELFQGLLFAHADRAKGRAAPSPEELTELFWRRYHAEWRNSESYSPESFLRAQREQGSRVRPWLQPHAGAFYAGVSLQDSSVVNRQRDVDEWTKGSAEKIPQQFLSAFSDPPIDRWRLIEGMEIADGDVAGVPAEEQQKARARREFPTIYWPTTFGRATLWFPIRCTVDFAYWADEVRNELVIADLKDTKEMKEEHLEQMDLYGWFYRRRYEEIDPERISFALYYPYLSALGSKGKVRRRKFGLQRHQHVERRLSEQIAEVLKHFVSLDSEELSIIDLCSVFANRDIPYLLALSAFARTGVWPVGAVHLPDEMGHTRGKRLVYPEVQQVCLWVRQNLSPLEILLGFSPAAPDLLERQIQSVQEQLPPFQRDDKEVVNTRLLELAVPSLEPLEFFRQFSVSHLLIGRAESFMPTMAMGDTPFYCQGCSFFSMCDPGQAAVSERQTKAATT